ncbi:Signal transduction histidine-protein kinase/phosphatase DegS [bacterium HR28]|uniref:GAF domain-containing sensor histidine kinase n=1 Tax=Thermomicrobium roseum TaxID=500 RepID=A0A7C1G4W0_THERO|nr:Signal transduction histidine-protein kinase/phosphatase DegS [bacterium HR28]
MPDQLETTLNRSLRRLKRLGIVLPLGFLAVLVVLGHGLVPIFGVTWTWVLTGTLAVLGVVGFADWIFRLVGQLHRQLLAQHAELVALHEAGLAITADLDLSVVLQRVIDQARRLVGARYGLLILQDDHGIRTLFTSGYSHTEACEIGETSGHGILDQVLREGRTLCIDDLERYPGERRYPRGHIVMRSLLGVPIRSGEAIVGGLYLADREDGCPFDEQDRSRLERFATQAALAITNARLHRRLTSLAVIEERERIAREMHDSLAQVLGYVITKASALRELLRQPERLADAERHLRQLEQAARDAYADVREAILGLRTGLAPNRTLLETLRTYLERWQDQSGIAAALVVEPSDDVLRGLQPMAELQLLRIVQEALANVRKHARATQVTVKMTRLDGVLHVRIEDNGVGFDPTALERANYPRFGLATMRERAEAVGGSLTINSRPGNGTTIEAVIPLGVVPVGVDGGEHARLDRR